MTIVPDKEAEFRGIYLAHCLEERIDVEVGRRLGVFTRYESWKPTFPHGFKAPGYLPWEGYYPAGLPFSIRFVGTPGKSEICGYKGCCRRRVIVHQILDLKEV